eukprot:scaffold13529_cov101-Isochrysis_galbana.AAC.1
MAEGAMAVVTMGEGAMAAAAMAAAAMVEAAMAGTHGRARPMAVGALATMADISNDEVLPPGSSTTTHGA